MNQSQSMSESRPSVSEVRDRLKTEMTGSSRMVYTLLLLFDLAVGIVIASLLLTEEGLPVRTRVAFTGMLVIAVVWAVFFFRALGSRKLFLAGHRLVAARLALAFSALFTLSALVLATMFEDVRSSALAASGFGVAMFAVAIALFIKAKRRVNALIARRNQLEHQVAGRNASSGAALVLTLLVTLLMGSDSAFAQAISPNPFEAIIPAPPIPVRALGRDHLVYELHLTNFGHAPHRLVALSAFDEGERSLAVWNAEELAARAANIGNLKATPVDLLLLRGGERKVLHLWLSLPPGAKRPELLTHRLTTALEVDRTRHELEIPSVQLDGEALLLKSAPVPPGRWVSIRGPSNTSGHRRSLVPLEGRVRVPQRFAVDWAKLGVDGKLFEGDGRENAEWYGYDLPVFAVLPGRVEKVIDGIEENAPLVAPDEAMVNRENAAGNAVIVRVAEGQYAIYAHLRPGSIRVKPGDVVEAADELGRIGNSGHSFAPHLHFHLADRPDVLASEGLPFLMSKFQLGGRIDSPAGLLKGEGWEPRVDRPARGVSDEMPLENMVLDVD